MRGMLVKTMVLGLLLAAPVAGSDWPRFRGPNADGMSPEKGINKSWNNRPPKLLWRIPMTDGGFAGPSVAGGKVFIIDHKGANDIVRAIDIKTGRDVWSFPYADSSRANYGFARSTPVIDGDRVYTVSRLGLVHCLTVKAGRKVWARDLRREFGGRSPKWQYAMSPLVDGNKVIVVPGGPNACVAALNKKTGKTIWKGGGSDVPGYATPVAATIGGRKQYVVFTATNLIGVDTKTGRRLWAYPWRTRYDVNAPTPIVIGSTIFITTGYRHGCALLKISGGRARRVWENKSLQSQLNTPIVSGRYAYSSSDPNKLVCLDLKTGNVKWEQRGFGKGGLVGVDGTIIGLDGSRGTITMFEMRPDGYKELGRIAGLGGKSWTAPIVADGKLIVRNERALACYSLK